MNTVWMGPASRLLWVYAFLFIILGIGYSTLTPIFENSDETLHYPYVKHLADGRGLPLAVPGQLWNQEGTQHPLYYLIVAASTFWIDSDNLPDHLQYNPHWLFAEVRTLINDNQNLVLHGPMDRFPYRRAALAIHIGRWWSLVFGLLTVIGAFFIARHLFPNDLPLTLTATTLTAFNPQFIRVSTTVSNDSLAAALTTLTVLLALKLTESYRFGNRQALLLGFLTGLSLLTKLSSLTTLLIVSFIIFWRLIFLGELHQAPWQKMIRWLAIIGLTTAALSGWWFFRNYQLYGEWLATETHLNLAGHGHLSLAEIWRLRAEIERAYWATFGWGQIRPPEWVFGLLFWLTRLGLIGLSLAVVAKIVQGAKTGPLPLNLENINLAQIIILLLWAGLNLAFYLRWVALVGSVSHTRLIFPAIAAISLLLALGWHALLPRRLAAGFSGLLTLFFLSLNIYSLGWLIYPAFSPIEGRQIETAASASSQSLLARFAALLPFYALRPYAPFTDLNLTFLDSLKLARGQVYPQDQNPASAKFELQARQGDVVMVNVMWQVLASLDKNYSVAAVLLAPDGSVLARRETYPGLGLRPTRYLQPGQTFLDVYPLKLEVNVAQPVVARAVVNLFDFDSETRAGLPALDKAGHEVTPVVGQIKVVPKPWPHYQPEHSTYVTFADAIALTGYDLTPAPPETQNPLDIPSEQAKSETVITLYWETLAPVGEDYVVFLHLLDEAGQVVAQADAPPTHNAYPTSWWAPGEVIADTRALPLTTETTALRLGLYQLASGRRLTISESSLPTQDNGVEIALP